MSGFSYSAGIAWQHGSEQFVVDQSLRKAKIKFMRSPVRNVDKSVEILFQEFERIGFQVSPFVVIRETREVIAARVETERSAAISFFVSARSSARKS